jgi:hypothetical protein
MAETYSGIAGGLRLVLRWFAAGAPYSWFEFATRYKPDGLVVGKDFFKKFAEQMHAGFAGQGTPAGLMESFAALKSDDFDPALVHPLIHQFYEETTKFDMKVEIHWNPLVKPFGFAYQWLIARQMDALIIPLDNESMTDLDAWLELIDVDNDQHADIRCWVRVLKTSRVPVYVGAYKTYKSRVDGRDATYVSVAFPIPYGSVTTVLSPQNSNGNSLVLTSHNLRSSESGVYFVFPHERSFSMMPALGLSEHFHLEVPASAEPLIKVQHDCYWLGVPAFQMKYTITYMRDRKQATAEKVLDAARAHEAAQA